MHWEAVRRVRDQTDDVQVDRRFRDEWPSVEKLEPIQKLTNYPDKRLVFKFIDVTGKSFT